MHRERVIHFLVDGAFFNPRDLLPSSQQDLRWFIISVLLRRKQGRREVKRLSQATHVVWGQSWDPSLGLSGSAGSCFYSFML